MEAIASSLISHQSHSPRPYNCLGKFRRFILMAVERALERGHSEKDIPRDELTSMGEKSAIYTPEGIKSIREKLKGDRFEIVMFDVANMAIANDCYGKDMVNGCLFQIYEIARQVFGENNFELVRIGGDEFVLILKDDEKNNEKKKEFETALEACWQQELNQSQIDDAKKQKAIMLAQIKYIYRHFLSKHWTQGINPDEFLNRVFSQLQLRDRISHPSALMGILGDFFPETADFSETDFPDFMGNAGESMIPVLQLHEASIDNAHLVATKIPAYLQQLDDKISAQKRDSSQDSSTPAHHDNPHDYRYVQETLLCAQEREEWLKVELEARKNENNRTAMRRASFYRILLNEDAPADPDLELRIHLNTDHAVGCLRGTMVGQISEYRHTAPEGTPLSAYKIDVNYFGVINNALGYAVADQLLRHIYDIVMDNIPHATVFRYNGGGLGIVASAHKIENKGVNLCHEIATFVKQFICEYMKQHPDAKSRAEYETVLKRLLNGLGDETPPEQQKELGKVDFHKREDINSSMNLEALFFERWEDE